jgi:iron(III) transport system permease protein
LLILPLAVPGYVGAECYITLLGKGGWLDEAFGLGGMLPDVYTTGSATAIFTLLLFPYVYLPVGAVLRTLNRSVEEAARVAGRSPFGVFLGVTLPLILPGIASGALVIALYVLGDFGTVGILRLFTFTSAVYNQFAGGSDRSGAAILSGMLLCMTVPLILFETWVLARSAGSVGTSQWKPARPQLLGRWRWLATTFVIGVLLISLGVPLLVFGGQAAGALLRPTTLDALYGYGQPLASVIASTLMLAVASSLGAIVVSVAPSYFSVRQPGRLGRAIIALCRLPYALPGVIAGLGMVFIFNQPLLAPLYGTAVALFLGLIVRLLPHTVANSAVAYRSVAPIVEQASRSMGRGEWVTWFTVTLPIARPGLVAATVTAFVTAMKELPMVLLLRPPGWDTLAIRVWSAARDSVYSQAALPALLLILIAAIPLWVLYSRARPGTEWASSE